ncbi:galactosylceramide sulfotransferase-like [Ptychodera flava]|uniref:galactosylceramide sulfotransferase-like n=1 Tax=Ptychodera flava TaxID=63121 RepID=UPI00396A439D
MKTTLSTVLRTIERHRFSVFIICLLLTLSSLYVNNPTRTKQMYDNFRGYVKFNSPTSNVFTADDPTPTVPQSCRPLNRFVFIKPEKTGGSTVSTLLHRFGMKNELVAAIQSEGFVIKVDKENHHLGILYYNCSDFPGYDYICSHVKIYDRLALERVVPNAKYFTIVRSPYTHLKSWFYFKMRNMNLSMSPDPFALYLNEMKENVMVNMKLKGETNSFCHRFDLDIHANETSSLEALHRLNRELDLVMIMEYFDESLVLLKKAMCWDFEDIIYHPCKVHAEYQPPTTDEMRDIITQLSHADIRLYDYFNKTFWRRVDNYDGDFKADLSKFRSMQDAARARCERNQKNDFCFKLHSDVRDFKQLLYKKQLKWMC